MPKKRVKMAIAYDFDGTLAPGNMQEHNFLPSIHMKPKQFWKDVNKEAKEHQADAVLVYMNLMLEKARANKIPITKKAFRKHGKNLRLFEGVKDWFGKINEYARAQGAKLEHYLISSGNTEIIMGTPIAGQFKRIYASKYIFDVNNCAQWPALAINYTTKTQFLFRINKGVEDINDNNAVNKYIEKDKRPIPFENIIFIGDGETDIPCFRLVKEQGGMSIAVYEKNKRGARKKAEEYSGIGRVDCALPADYSKQGKIFDAVCRRIDLMVARYKFDNIG